MVGVGTERCEIVFLGSVVDPLGQTLLLYVSFSHNIGLRRHIQILRQTGRETEIDVNIMTIAIILPTIILQAYKRLLRNYRF